MDEETERLNWAAYASLQGASETPERHLAALLRSGREIMPEVREAFADALIGRGGGRYISLRAGTTKVGKGIRSVLRWENALSRGKEARQMTARGVPYEEALRQVASDHRVDAKTVGRDYTLAGNAAEWLRKMSNRIDPALAKDEPGHHSYAESIYLAALRRKIDPTERLDAVLANFETMEQVRQEKLKAME